MIEEIEKEVLKILQEDHSGHGYDHIKRVLQLSLKFCEKEQANQEIVSLIALLHDVDDYKLFGIKQAYDLTNAKRIMNLVDVNQKVQEEVLTSLKCIGYSKAIQGIRPKTIEGMIVSDADMCDAIGAHGIIRVYTYSMKHHKPFFDRYIFPRNDLSVNDYMKKVSDSSVCHMFEKLLKLKDMMLTNAGKEEAQVRHQMMVDFLYQLFDEENAGEWKVYLKQYLKGE